MEDLHIPAKFDKLRAEQLVRRVADRIMRGRDWEREDFIKTTAEVLKKLGEGDRQNWLEVERWAGRAVTGAAIFDAVIDATQGSNAAIHQYKNLTELLSAEIWASTRLFVVGVRASTTSIVETGSMTLQGPLAMLALGAIGSGGGSYASWPLFGVYSRQVWDINGNQIRTTSGDFSLYLKMLHIVNNGGSVSPMCIQSG